MGELAFGEPFHCLKNDESHYFLRLMESSATPLAILQALHRFEAGRLLEQITIKLPILQNWFQTILISADKVNQRFYKRADYSTRQDVMSLIWRNAEADNAPISMHQAAQLANLLCLTGAETASTSIAGLTY